jgi:hypothetical protein
LCIGTFLAALKWEDKDRGEGGGAALSISGDQENLLFLNVTSPDVSVLTLAKDLDLNDLLARGVLADDNSTYRVLVTATDKGTTPLSSSVVLALRVLETQPSVPVFTFAVYNLSVPENVPSRGGFSSSLSLLSNVFFVSLLDKSYPGNAGIFHFPRAGFYAIYSPSLVIPIYYCKHLWPQIFCLLLQKLVQWRLTWQTERQHR